MQTTLTVDGEAFSCQRKGCGGRIFTAMYDNINTCNACGEYYQGSQYERLKTLTAKQAKARKKEINAKGAQAREEKGKIEADYREALEAWKERHAALIDEVAEDKMLLVETCPHDWYGGYGSSTCQICGKSVHRSM